MKYYYSLVVGGSKVLPTPTHPMRGGESAWFLGIKGKNYLICRGENVKLSDFIPKGIKGTQRYF